MTYRWCGGAVVRWCPDIGGGGGCLICLAHHGKLKEHCYSIMIMTPHWLMTATDTFLTLSFAQDDWLIVCYTMDNECRDWQNKGQKQRNSYTVKTWGASRILNIFNILQGLSSTGHVSINQSISLTIMIPCTCKCIDWLVCSLPYLRCFDDNPS